MATMRKPVLRPSFDSSFMMVLTWTVVMRVRSGRELLVLAGKVDVDLRLGGFGSWSETPAADCVLRGRGEQSMTGLYFGGRDLAVGLDGDQQHDLAADVHAASEFRIGGGD